MSALPVQPVVERFGQDPDRFLSAGLKLGGQSVDYGDNAIQLMAFRETPLTFVLWQADDEFAASVNVLFDTSIAGWFELDMVFLLVQQVSLRMAAE